MQKLYDWWKLYILKNWNNKQNLFSTEGTSLALQYNSAQDVN